MSPVEPGLPHACLSPQTQHATLFSHATQHYVNLRRPSPANNPVHTKDNTHRGAWHTLTDKHTHVPTQTDAVEPATQAHFSNQHTFYAATQPVRARSCDCLLLVFEIQEGELQTKLRFTGREWPYQHLPSSITCSRGKSTWISKAYFIIATTTAPPTGGQQNKTQQDAKVVMIWV